MPRLLMVTALAGLLTADSSLSGSQQTPESRVKAVESDPAVARAIAALDRDHDRLVSEIIAINEIPAPPFKEQARGEKFMAMLRAHGLTDVERDQEGNVMGIRAGANPAAPILAVVAHLDTVFPEGTNVRVQRSGTKLSAPGIGDNARSLAVLLAMIRALDEAKVATSSNILFVGSVGEEGLGDLRGVKFLLRQGRYKDRIKQVIAVDGSDDGSEIVNAGVGSKRYRVEFKGPGGHSYSAYGLVNPAFAMGAAMQKLAAMTVPARPKTTFNVGVVGGGTSVNTIPQSVWMEVDMRSESAAELEKLEAAFLAAVKAAVTEENRARSTSQGTVTADLKKVGDRPSGTTPPEAPLVRMAMAAARTAGLTPTLAGSSTDANLPMSLGIPAIRMNSGGAGDRAHAPDEWIDVDKSRSLPGMRVLLITIVAAAR